MNTKKISGIILIVAIIGFIIWKAETTKAPVVEKPETTTSIEGAVKDADGNFEYKKETDVSVITLKYPGQTSLESSADAKARLTMENGLKARVADFETNIVGMIDAREEARLKESGRKYSLGIDYKAYSSPKYISYVFQAYEDTGGAHGNGTYMTFTFNQNGEKIELADLFKTDSRYLDRLSKISYDFLVVDLAKRFESKLDDSQIDWIRMGTAPTPEAIQFYYMDGQNLVLIYPPYQVAPYVAGESRVVIPLSNISDILK